MKKKEKIQTKNWTYLGEVKDGKPHGKGKMVMDYNDGAGKDIYTGEFKDGKFHGKGKIEFKLSGEKYVGIWKNGIGISGKSISSLPYSYEGEWDKETIGLPNGKGIRRLHSGTIEEGVFHFGKLIRGRKKHKDGTEIIGEWKIRDGSDEIIYSYSFYIDKKKKHKIQFHGEFINGKKKFLLGEGAKIETKKSKETFYKISIGKFKEGLLEGEGRTIQYKDQSLKKPTWFYFGKFKNGKAYGKGKSIQEPFDHLHEVKCKDNKILDVKTYKMNKQQIKEFYEDYYDKAINILSFEKYKYNQLPKELRKLIN